MEAVAWLNVASEYASTAEGRDRLSREAADADLSGDIERHVALQAALRRGDSLREVAADVALHVGRRSVRSLRQADVDRVKKMFGVADAQVRRDHLISHVLAALTACAAANDLVFFGGTALTRAYLPTLRLSEDVDLLTRGNRAGTAREIDREIQRRLQRSHGQVRWDPPLLTATTRTPAVLWGPGGELAVQVQLLDARDYPDWPTETRPLVQRYTDAPPARLRTLTPAAFSASKTAAWHERHAPRDLYDVWALGQNGYITPEARRIFREATGIDVADSMFTKAPTEHDWLSTLAQQGRIAVTADEALAAVQGYWRAAIDDPRP